MEKLMEKLSIKELINCMETHGYIKEPDEIKFDDISVFFGTFTKNNNDRTNKLRETIIEKILNKKIPKQWYSSPEWFKVALGLKNFVKLLNQGELKEVELKAGRKFNYDFLFNNHIKVEFKNGVKTITEYPEILSVSSNNFVKGMTYPELFYDFYLSALTNHELPTKEYYLKNIHKNVVNHPFFIHLKEVDTSLVSPFKITVDESIDDYLVKCEFDFIAFKEKLKHQLDKKFMLWKNDQFYLDFLLESDIDIIPEKNLKKGTHGFYNTVVIKSENGKAEYHLLLRWKNHAGVLFPAWQIKFKRNV